MSYYASPFKYKISNHAISRARERLHLQNSSVDFIHEKLEEYLEYSVLESEDEEGKVYKNLKENITIVVDNEDKIIKTVF